MNGIPGAFLWHVGIFPCSHEKSQEFKSSPNHHQLLRSCKFQSYCRRPSNMLSPLTLPLAVVWKQWHRRKQKGALFPQPPSIIFSRTDLRHSVASNMASSLQELLYGIVVLFKSCGSYHDAASSLGSILNGVTKKGEIKSYLFQHADFGPDLSLSACFQASLHSYEGCDMSLL